MEERLIGDVPDGVQTLAAGTRWVATSITRQRQPHDAHSDRLVATVPGGDQPRRDALGGEGSRAPHGSDQPQLDLSSHRCRGDGSLALTRLTGLSSLYLSGNRVTDAGVRALAPLAALTSLDLAPGP
eukprot:4832402-Pyramimonas_sp.AAC.1